MPNPYDPQNPAKPDYFGGRKNVLEQARKRIEKAVESRQSGGILAYGHRGVGKTSLLNKIRSIVEMDDALTATSVCIYRRLSKTTSDAELYQLMVESVVEEVNQRKNVIEKMAGRIKSAKIFDVELRLDDGFAQKSPYMKWRAVNRNMSNAGFVMVEIDDADYLSPEALSELKTVVEDQNATPVLLVVSGGIEFEERLVEDYSPVARAFSGASFNLGEFDFVETKEVLEKPLIGSNTAWSEDGILRVHYLSGGYPFLVQSMAYASYREEGVISAARVEETLESALDIAGAWLKHELQDASDNDIRSFEKIVRTNKQILKSSEMSKVGVDPVYIGRLVKLKVLRQISRGRYKLIKAPIVCHYHVLKRGLKESAALPENGKL